MEGCKSKLAWLIANIEGQKDVAQGKEMFKQKREWDKANKKSEKEGPLPHVNKNNPILVPNKLPPPTGEALMVMSTEAGQACLLQHLDKHADVLKS